MTTYVNQRGYIYIYIFFYMHRKFSLERNKIFEWGKELGKEKKTFSLVQCETFTMYMH